MKPRQLAFTLCLAPVAAFAQTAPDIDAQIQRLKGIPGTEEAVKQLEAHRAEIKKAEGAAAAAAPKQDTGPRAPVDIEPVKSFSGIPEPPRTALEAIKRFGHWSDHEGPDTACDLQTRDLHARMGQWTRDLNEHALRYATAGGGVSASAVALSNTWVRMQAELLECQKRFGAAAEPAKGRYTAKLNQIEADYSAKINACLDANERAGGSSCDYLYREKDDKIVEAGTAFLGEYNGICADYRQKLHAIAAEGQEALDQARKTLGAKVPASADGAFTRITTLDMVALGDAVDAEDQATIVVHDATRARVWMDDTKRLGITD